jgi:hypothetical protein
MYICKIYLDRSDGLNEDRSEKRIQQSTTLIEKFFFFFWRDNWKVLYSNNTYKGTKGIIFPILKKNSKFILNRKIILFPF